MCHCERELKDPLFLNRSNGIRDASTSSNSQSEEDSVAQHDNGWPKRPCRHIALAYNAGTRRGSAPLKHLICLLFLLATAFAQTTAEKQQLLWQKLESTIDDVDQNIDGVLGVAVLDLTTGQKFLLHADEVFPQASSIKIAVLAELYHQAQNGKLKLTDLYTVESSDLVPDSYIMAGLTPGVTRITLRDLATMMVAVSDNSATNVLIDRVGMDNVNAFLNALGLRETKLRRKMMDLKAAAEGRENVSTPGEMMTLLQALYRGEILNKEMTADFFKVLSSHKDSWIPRDLPDDLKIAD